MRDRSQFLRRVFAPAAMILSAGAVLSVVSCSSVDPATRLTRELLAMPKDEAYAKGDSLIAKKKFELGRQYLRFVAENYANDPIGKQAALRLADSFFDEKTPLGYLEAQARYKDFRNRYPSHPRSDYALFRLAQTSDRQAERSDRDQSNTRLAANSYRELIQAYPDSPYAAEARARLKVVKDLLAEHEYKVGHFYLKRKSYAAAKSRFDVLLSAFPDYRGIEIVLYEAGLSERKLGHEEDANALWGKLAQDFPASIYLKRLPREIVKRSVPAAESLPETAAAPAAAAPVSTPDPIETAPTPISVVTTPEQPVRPEPEPSAAAGSVAPKVSDIKSPEWAGREPVFVVHFSSYRDKPGADSDAATLARRFGKQAHVVQVDLGDKGNWYRVLLGDFTTAEQAFAFRAEAEKSTTPHPGLVYRLVSS